MNETTNPIDVAIIGGGVSGIYSGWRLLGADGGAGHSDPKPSVLQYHYCSTKFIGPDHANLQADPG